MPHLSKKPRLSPWGDELGISGTATPHLKYVHRLSSRESHYPRPSSRDPILKTATFGHHRPEKIEDWPGGDSCQQGQGRAGRRGRGERVAWRSERADCAHPIQPCTHHRPAPRTPPLRPPPRRQLQTPSSAEGAGSGGEWGGREREGCRGRKRYSMI